MPGSKTARGIPTEARDHRDLWIAGLLVLAVLLVYGQAWRFEFIDLDDPAYVSDNSHVLQGLTLRNIAWSFGAFHDSNWIPLTWLSLMLDAEFFGSRPGGYHVVNILFHAANAVLLFLVLAKATREKFRSGFVAALFALHPLHVESVAWITERKDVLSIFGGLLSLWAYVSYSTSGRRRSLIAAWTCFVLSLLAKQTLVTLPFLFLLLDYWPLGRMKLSADEEPSKPDVSRTRPRSVARLIGEKAPFFAVSAVFSIIAVIAQRSGSNVLATLGRFPLTARILNALLSYVAYLEKTFVPRDLSVFYPHPGGSLIWTGAVVSAVILTAISVAAVVGIRRLPFLFVGWAWYLGTLLPMIGIVQVGQQQMADRYTYFPTIGIYLALVWLVTELMAGSPVRARALPWTGMAVLVLLAATAFVQIGYWQDSEILFRHGLDCTPDDPFLMESLGQTLIGKGNVDEGLALLESAARIPPPTLNSQFHLAIALQRIGRVDEAIQHYQAAIAIDDSSPQVHNHLAVLLHVRGQFHEAKRHLQRAIEIDPDFSESYLNLGIVCLALNEHADAIANCERALRIEPDLENCHLTIARALRAQGRYADAIRQFELELEVSPSHQLASQELARTQALLRGSSPAEP